MQRNWLVLTVAGALFGACGPGNLEGESGDDETLHWSDAQVPYSAPVGGHQLAAVEDSRIKSCRPDRNYGDSEYLRVRQRKCAYRSYLKFTLSGVLGTVTSARLALFVLNGSPDGGTVYTTSNSWDEGSITWNNAPPLGSPIGSAGRVTEGQWVTVDLAGAVTGNGTYSFALKSGSSNSAFYSSREGGRSPLLVVFTDSKSAPSAPDSGAIGVDGEVPSAPDGGVEPSPDSGVPPDPDAGPPPDPDTGPAPDPDTGPPPDPDTGPPPDPDTGPPPDPDTGPPPDPDTGPPPTPATGGIWISAQELAQRPTSGPAWQELVKRASGSCGTPDLSDQDDPTNVCILAKALVYARTGQSSYRTDVLAALSSVANSGTYSGRALALGRELGAYVIAADLIDLKTANSTLDNTFRAKIKALLTTYTDSGPASLVECHEKRPNNWGTHCGGARVAVAAYLGDQVELAKAAQVFRGWLGDRSSYASFKFGSDLSWQCDPAKPVGINPKGCTKSGHNIDGVIPDDQRRGGSFSWPPPKENYVYEAMQGALMQAVILERAGYAIFSLEDQALLRVFNWLHQQASFPAEGDDTWQPHLINHFYSASFPAPLPSKPGKNIGFTDWTHGT
jgi:hypothetical protein